MALYRVNSDCEDKCIEANEIFPDMQLGVLQEKPAIWCLVVGCKVVMTFDKELPSDLQKFYEKTWNSEPTEVAPAESDRIIAKYDAWLAALPESKPVMPQPVDRRAFSEILMSASYPPSNRPTLVPPTRRLPPRRRRIRTDICRSRPRPKPGSISIDLRPGRRAAS